MNSDPTNPDATPPEAVPEDEGDLSPAERRRRDALLRVDLSRGQSLNESMSAQKLVDDFVAQARARRLVPEPLRARLMDGHEVKTDKSGWYLRRDHSIAIGTDGGYYVLTVPGGWAERLRGVKLEKTPPPLVVGRGSTDGDSGDLSFFLDRRLQES